MTELELLNLARSTTSNEVSMFGEVIAINFAMVVAIYYFLHQARLAIRIFAFVAYTFGAFLYLSQMLVEANIKVTVFAALKALPARSLSEISKHYLEVNDSWLGYVAAFAFNGAFYILWLGVFYLLFFWKKHETVARSDVAS
ncbi:MAG: hypothetical protein ABSC92_00135 [Rhizomicrobium sp.]